MQVAANIFTVVYIYFPMCYLMWWIFLVWYGFFILIKLNVEIGIPMSRGRSNILVWGGPLMKEDNEVKVAIPPKNFPSHTFETLGVAAYWTSIWAHLLILYVELMNVQMPSFKVSYCQCTMTSWLIYHDLLHDQAAIARFISPLFSDIIWMNKVPKFENQKALIAVT